MNKYYSDETFSQPSVSELKERSKATKKSDKEKGRRNNPVIPQGKNIVDTWWGRAWCENLEQYADYESRLERGRRYIKAGTIINLDIKKGKISAKVQGTRKNPYKVEIKISPVSEGHAQEILKKCGQKIDKLETLVNGEFPEEMAGIFTGEGGLFPTPREISFSCSCPDWALMCKHVAAALYGVGVRLDEDPLLFFKLRGLDVEHFVDVAIATRVEEMLLNYKVESDRIISNEDMIAMFGVI